MERPSRDLQLVHAGAPSVRVRHFVIETQRGVRHSAELTAQACGLERAVVDAASRQELRILVEHAARAFAQSVRIRQRRAERT